MSDLRNKVIKLAYEKKELRNHLLPLIKQAYSEDHRDYMEEVVEENLLEIAKKFGIRDFKRSGSGYISKSSITEDQFLELVDMLKKSRDFSRVEFEKGPNSDVYHGLMEGDEIFLTSGRGPHVRESVVEPEVEVIYKLDTGLFYWSISG